MPKPSMSDGSRTYFMPLNYTLDKRQSRPYIVTPFEITLHREHLKTESNCGEKNNRLKSLPTVSSIYRVGNLREYIPQWPDYPKRNVANGRLELRHGDFCGFRFGEKGDYPA